jgi:hypothetical protein
MPLSMDGGSGKSAAGTGTSSDASSPAGYAPWGRSFSVTDTATFATAPIDAKPPHTPAAADDAWDALASSLGASPSAPPAPSDLRSGATASWYDATPSRAPPQYHETVAAATQSVPWTSPPLPTQSVPVPVPSKMAPPPPRIPAKPAWLPPPGSPVNVPVALAASFTPTAALAPPQAPSMSAPAYPWTLRGWLEAAGLAHLEGVLTEHGFDNRIYLAQLTYSDMLACGIVAPNDQRALAAAVRVLLAS